jgi:hypothetical protein
LGVIRNLCAVSGAISYARCNNNSDHSPQRRHGFPQRWRVQALPNNSGNFAIFAANRRASIPAKEEPIAHGPR